jgi:peptidoglycan/LPS O-acetylase OafA/YrhL
VTDGAAIEPRGFPGLNALRALGAFMVLLTHSAFDTGRIQLGWTGGVLARLDYGVAIFFVLSGFLLSRPFLQRAVRAQPRPSTRHYLWKRGLRILPLYWLTVGAAYMLEPENRADLDGAAWLRSLTLTQLYQAGLLPTGLTQMWSLATEAAFYLVLPVLCLVLLGRRGRFSETRVLVLLAVISVAGFVWQGRVATIPGYEGHYAQWLPGYLPWFCAGIALATVTVANAERGRDWLTRVAADATGCWFVSAAVFGLACTPLAGPRNLDQPTASEAVLKAVLYAVSATMLVLPLVIGPQRDGWVRRACAHPVPTFLGEISYGVFCLHVLVMKGVFRATDTPIFTGSFPLIALTTAVITVFVATLAHYVVERPFLRLKEGRPPSSRATRARARATTSSH